jgi:hypothetical protein
MRCPLLYYLAVILALNLDFKGKYELKRQNCKVLLNNAFQKYNHSGKNLFFATYAISVTKIRHHDDKTNAIICALNAVFLKPIILSEKQGAAGHNSIVPSFRSHDLVVRL